LADLIPGIVLALDHRMCKRNTGIMYNAKLNDQHSSQKVRKMDLNNPIYQGHNAIRSMSDVFARTNVPINPKIKNTPLPFLQI
jgi:hypothetical protein